MAHNKVAATASLVGTVKGESKGSALNSPCIPGLVCHASPRAPKAALAPGDSQDHRVLSSVAWPSGGSSQQSSLRSSCVSGMSTVTLILTATQENIS